MFSCREDQHEPFEKVDEAYFGTYIGEESYTYHIGIDPEQPDTTYDQYYSLNGEAYTYTLTSGEHYSADGYSPPLPLEFSTDEFVDDRYYYSLGGFGNGGDYLSVTIVGDSLYFYFEDVWMTNFREWRFAGKKE